MTLTKPVVLCFSGHDPSGGAGIQADIETLFSHQCHSCSVITALTEQNTGNVSKLLPQPAEEIYRQCRTLLDDCSIQAIKIGLLGHEETVDVIHRVITELPDVPVVLDPVLAAGGGAALSNAGLINRLVKQLLPLCSILTPNSLEARQLAKNTENLDMAALTLLDHGVDYVLITGTHEATTTVRNRLYHQQRCIETYTWDRLPHSYHGSGCTLASSIAALLAFGIDPVIAVNEAQEYTWNALKHGLQPGRGQHVPNRAFWSQDTE